MIGLWDRAKNKPPIMTSVGEYAGQSRVRIAPTQLGPEYSRTEAQRIVYEWVEFFSAGPSPIQDLEFTSRTPKRLFNALESQTQLRQLVVKWGDYEELGVLTGMTSLTRLRLGGASSVRTLGPLAELTMVETLEIESLRHAHVLDPIGQMSAVRDLVLGGDWMSLRTAHVDSISFLSSMPQLERLLLHTIVVDDLDYSPILALPSLRSVRVMEARGMTPSHQVLRALGAWDDG